MSRLRHLAREALDWAEILGLVLFAALCAVLVGVAGLFAGWRNASPCGLTRPQNMKRISHYPLDTTRRQTCVCRRMPRCWASARTPGGLRPLCRSG